MTQTIQAIEARYPRRDGKQWRSRIRSLLLERRVRMVVIDDDPTGIQTVHGCLMLTEFTQERVGAALDDREPFFYLLVNSRAMTESDARKVVREAVEAVLAANQTRGYNLLFVSRSDSTLRGHFPAEPDTIREVVEAAGLALVMPLLFTPAFFEAGRYTIEGVHYMQRDEELIPVNETEFARDNVFGYRNARLTDYLVEKGGGTIRAEELAHLDLATLRDAAPEALGRWIESMQTKRCISIDAFDYDDLGRLSVAIIERFPADCRNTCGIIRCSSSLPKALSGIEERSYVAAEHQGARGVVVVGSHVRKSTEQLMCLLESAGVRGVEIDVERILNDDPAQMQELLQQAARHHAEGFTPVLYTSRREVRCDDAARRQALGAKISRFLVEAVRELPFRPDFLVSKGGITSHDILTHSLGVRMARVEGQAAAGIPTIRTAHEDRFPDMRYIIFPGNVGAVETLREVVERLQA